MTSAPSFIVEQKPVYWFSWNSVCPNSSCPPTVPNFDIQRFMGTYVRKSNRACDSSYLLLLLFIFHSFLRLSSCLYFSTFSCTDGLRSLRRRGRIRMVKFAWHRPFLTIRTRKEYRWKTLRIWYAFCVRSMILHAASCSWIRRCFYFLFILFIFLFCYYNDYYYYFFGLIWFYIFRFRLQQCICGDAEGAGMCIWALTFYLWNVNSSHWKDHAPLSLERVSLMQRIHHRSLCTWTRVSDWQDRCMFFFEALS